MFDFSATIFDNAGIFPGPVVYGKMIGFEFRNVFQKKSDKTVRKPLELKTLHHYLSVSWKSNTGKSNVMACVCHGPL